ncbi:hypothetical protein EMIHUDRAFT_213905 [Emiliania huxleyi CCMP1516]|uniref:PH domain-containing protein n=2 Tax=Emiliania huxleyi TaxID=2903 RepID=A0A0D3ILJ3_EMIH1|nr:hypothetical protein EMIHUDRAFT_213905 [Emiliania huxleyi CCMP1516]EOD12128.1 hypothetical protein EMIHUDRAFT_213905 [Emiliania huxleyi CCMP1516]|eukprot:XP_005764557.1 hypothetical protein EMIHUDRAFT_213905 [Emiliania huxleyi CCMP1516]
MTASYRLSAALALLSLPRGGEGTSIKTDYLPLGHVRTDPILSQTCLTDHVHTFYGPNVMPRPEVTFEDLVATTDNTGNVEENKSLYWHPTVYRYDQLTGTYTRNEIGQSSAYYIWANEDSPRAFPPGFRMIAGRNGDTESEFPNAFAECVEPSPCLRPDGCHTENDFFPREACVELEVSMFFPNCWDGRLDSADHASHVAYTIEGGEISFFFRIFDYDGGWHTFSDGSSTFHADYISGWDQDFMQGVLDNCETESLGPNPDSFCEEHITFRDGPKCTDEATCDFASPILLEKLRQIQPRTLPDMRAGISPEATDVVSSLPRGTCTGTLLLPPGVAAKPPRPPAQPPAPPELCDDDGAVCGHLNDGECDDGGAGSVYSLCPYGKDCTDCGARVAGWAIPDARHEVRCCSGTQLGAMWDKRAGCDVWAESDGPEMGGCHHGKTFEEAEAVCAGAGARLCTKDELASDCTRGTGCGHDRDLARSSDPLESRLLRIESLLESQAASMERLEFAVTGLTARRDSGHSERRPLPLDALLLPSGRESPPSTPQSSRGPPSPPPPPSRLSLGTAQPRASGLEHCERCEGFLWKQAQHTSGFSRRWFELVGSELRYYEAPPAAGGQAPQPKTVVVSGATVAVAAPAREGGRHRLRLTPAPDKQKRGRWVGDHFSFQTYHLEAESEEDATRWHEALWARVAGGGPLAVVASLTSPPARGSMAELQQEGGLGVGHIGREEEWRGLEEWLGRDMGQDQLQPFFDWELGSLAGGPADFALATFEIGVTSGGLVAAADEAARALVEEAVPLLWCSLEPREGKVATPYAAEARPPLQR